MHAGLFLRNDVAISLLATAVPGSCRPEWRCEGGGEGAV